MARRNVEMFESGDTSDTSGNVNNGLHFTPQNNVETLNQYTAKTFGWMFLGLLATFAVAMAFYLTNAWVILYSIPMLPFILLIAEVVVVIALSARLNKIKASSAKLLFFVYASLNGVTFASFFVMYDFTSLVYVFGITALYFGGLALYGMKTKRDLTSLRPLLIGGLLVMAVFWVLSIFINLSTFETLMCFVGLAIFMGFTAYDTQKIKGYYNSFSGNKEMSEKTSIICALQLYLDFINIFIYMLRLLGRRNN